MLHKLLQVKTAEQLNLPVIDAATLTPSSRDFVAAISRASVDSVVEPPVLAIPPRQVIAEIKFNSPSAGAMGRHYSAPQWARCFTDAGAAAISVLTDHTFFHGSFALLQQVRAVSDVPILCKDIVISTAQIFLARAHGADACLLIVRLLSDEQLPMLARACRALAMTPVFEVFNEQDIQRARALAPEVILINHRDLDDFSVDMTLSQRLLPHIPERCVVIAASGFNIATDVTALSNRIEAVLIGSALMNSSEPAALIQAMRGESCA